MVFTTDAVIKSGAGFVHKLSHDSKCLGTRMKLNVYVPLRKSCPVLFYLGGLTCTGDNGIEKGGFLHKASELGLAMVFPDTSPRTTEGNTIKGEHDSYDLGSGAGFYINATAEPWSSHYQMETYIVEELPRLLSEQFPQFNWDSKGITGHSMGGHGALTLFLKYPNKFKSVSAFAPICNPTQCPWGQKAFTNYLGSVSAGEAHDATCILKRLGKDAPAATILIDVGTGDNFYKQGQLLPEHFKDAAAGTPVTVDLRFQEDYDHSYYFIQDFSENHLEFHGKKLYQ